MNFVKIIYDVVEIKPFEGLICVKDEKGEKSEIRLSIKDNKGLLLEIKKGDKLEVEVNGWQVRSIKRLYP